jgi:hypothetical protein
MTATVWLLTLPARSYARTVTRLDPSGSTMAPLDQLTSSETALCVARPDAPLSVTQVTRATWRLSLARPDKTRDFLLVTTEPLALGLVTLSVGRTRSSRDSACSGTTALGSPSSSAVVVDPPPQAVKPAQSMAREVNLSLKR